MLYTYMTQLCDEDEIPASFLRIFILLRIRHENGKVINVFIFFQYVKALYDFTPQEPGELEFRRGDIITGNNSIFYVQNSKVVPFHNFCIIICTVCN